MDVSGAHVQRLHPCKWFEGFTATEKRKKKLRSTTSSAAKKLLRSMLVVVWCRSQEWDEGKKKHGRMKITGTAAIFTQHWKVCFHSFMFQCCEVLGWKGLVGWGRSVFMFFMFYTPGLSVCESSVVVITTGLTHHVVSVSARRRMSEMRSGVKFPPPNTIAYTIRWEIAETRHIMCSALRYSQLDSTRANRVLEWCGVYTLLTSQLSLVT